MWKFNILAAARNEPFPFDYVDKKEENKMLDIKIKKVLTNAQLPVKGSAGAAGYDVFAATETIKTDKTGPIFEYDTGLSFQLPKGYGMFILPRSGITSKTTLILGNGIGLLDEDYTGTLKFQFRNTQQGFCQKYKVGDRIGQILVLPIPELNFVEVEELDKTERGEGGFGSSGN